MPALLSVAPASVVAAPAKSSSGGGSLIFILVIVLVLGFLLVNSRRRARTTAAAKSSIAVGSTVVTRAGLIATLVEENDAYVVLQLDDGTRVRFVPQAVARVWDEPPAGDIPDPEPPAEPRPLAD